ncbi:MAG TPA: RsmE family RNA methyltransferase, partial [Candidatus Cloacimonetes bacterium]|nr:RsmE family RNA methyltransferase [Candidatus Cloacimonadota bacterium]
MPSYYFPELKKSSSELILDSDEHHHLSRVRRAKIGQIILLNSGNGLLAEAEIIAIDKKESRIKILDVKEIALLEPGFSIAFSLLKNQHDELIIEKCTELGAREFFPLICENTVRTAGKNTLARFEKTALAA